MKRPHRNGTSRRTTTPRNSGSARGLTSRLTRRGAEANRTGNPEALTGKLVDIVTHVANTLAAFGEKLSAGDVITGSITPPGRSAK